MHNELIERANFEAFEVDALYRFEGVSFRQCLEGSNPLNDGRQLAELVKVDEREEFDVFGQGRECIESVRCSDRCQRSSAIDRSWRVRRGWIEESRELRVEGEITEEKAYEGRSEQLVSLSRQGASVAMDSPVKGIQPLRASAATGSLREVRSAPGEYSAASRFIKSRR